VLGQVEVTQNRQDALAERTRAMRAELIKDPVAAVAKGRVMNYLQEVEEGTEQTNSHLTEIMMAQDFHDLTGQVIARVVALAADLESQLLELLIQTSPDAAQMWPGACGSRAAQAGRPGGGSRKHHRCGDLAVPGG
jgi:chemotaxis protein CheZ